jgi:catechol 2,3-dioxygenase-like lactoylglutathione lyase family enzyme
MGIEGNGASPDTLQARLSLSLTVNDIATSRRFYTTGLGFEIEDELEDEGTVRFIMLRAGSASVGLGQDDFARGRNRVKGAGMRFWLTTSQDVNAIAEHAKAAGITLDNDPEPLPWGPLAFAVTDPDGFKLTIVQDG